MSRALAVSGRRPRTLPAGETLSAEDYRRLIGVLESVDHADDLPEFRQALALALQSWFGFTGVAVLHGDTFVDAVRAGCGIQAGYLPEFLDEYAAHWATRDPFRSEPAARLLAEQGVVRLAELDSDSEFVRDFLRPHGIRDKAALLVDGGAAGVLYVGMAACDTDRVPDRDMAALRALRRHLTPLVIEQLGRDRERRAAQSTWQLTPREWEVADLAARGLTNRQIAQRLFIGVDTVKKHLSRALAATSCTSRTQLAVRFAAA
ncbi:helix-turn-helix transcriptional regulator [Nocardia sp. BMG111209]|uniref:helix-turn-helix transcriptional regulator n=1 Tax=Nocardia sp. BMG111209 TaxID=1160137 RepID=UPI00039E6C0D|nr:helix-turn-helix transcriptional regulator [Nocardia sp. BMG111209]